MPRPAPETKQVSPAAESRKQPVVRVTTGGYHPDTGFRLYDGPVVTGGYGETIRDVYDEEKRSSTTETSGGGEKSPSR